MDIITTNYQLIDLRDSIFNSTSYIDAVVYLDKIAEIYYTNTKFYQKVFDECVDQVVKLAERDHIGRITRTKILYHYKQMYGRK